MSVRGQPHAAPGESTTAGAGATPARAGAVSGGTPAATAPCHPATAAELSAGRKRTISHIVRLLLPAYPELDAATKSRVHADASAFVISQIGAMPSFLRLPYKLAITGFELLPLARRGRRFHALAEEHQRSYLAFWSAAKIGAMRDFVKLIRSCALLAYFDHPSVAGRLPETEAATTSAPVQDTTEGQRERRRSRTG